MLGIETKLPQTVAEYMDGVLQSKKAPGLDLKLVYRKQTPAEGYETAAKMLIPGYVSGFYASSGNDSRGRVMEYREEYCKPGDVFFGLYDVNLNRVINTDAMDLFLYLGGGRVLTYSAKGGVSIGTYADTIGIAMKYNVFVGLRPALAYDDLNG